MIGILGGGITACTLQRFLKNPSEILEASPHLGGLCRTVTTPAGFKYDLGGHILFSKHDHVNKLVDELLGDNLRVGKRDSRILYRDKVGKQHLVKYPFTKGFGMLPKEEVAECLMGFLREKEFRDKIVAIDQHPGHDHAVNLKQWFIRTYGCGIADRNLIPYTEKAWKTPCDRLGLDFVSRIPPPSTEDMVRAALNIEVESPISHLKFRYPKEGGFEALVRAMHNHDHRNVTCNFPVDTIRWNGQHWVVTTEGYHGDVRLFDRIVSTIPLDCLVHCFRDAPADVLVAAKDLDYLSLIIVHVAFDRKIDFAYNPLYIADPDVIFHRISPTWVFSPSLVRPWTSALMLEITCRRGDGTYEMTDKDVVDRVLDDLFVRVGINPQLADYETETHVTRVEYGYPVPNLHHAECVGKIRKFFDRIGVHLCGRSGEWEYINSDECIHRSILLVNRLNEEVYL